MALDNNGKCTLLFPIPNYLNVQCIIAIIDSNGMNNTNMSTFHHQTLITRALINSEQNLIASPTQDDQQRIYVMIIKSFYETGNLQKLLCKYNLQYIEAPICDRIYEACLQYSIITRIAPIWNIVNQYLIEGCNFLCSGDVLNAVKLNVHVRGETAYLNIEPRRVRIPIVDTTYLVPLHRRSQTIVNDGFGNDFYMDFSSFNHYVFVLPSLKQGRVVEISKRIPQYSPFEKYSDIKSHWENMYGYKLPETDEDILYYSIMFFGKYFTYPNICLRRCGLVFMSQQTNCDHIVNSFISTFKVKCLMGFMNDNLLNRNIKLGHTNFNLQSAHKNISNNWEEVSIGKNTKNTAICEESILAKYEPNRSYDVNLNSSNSTQTSSYRGESGIHFTDLRLRQGVLQIQNNKNHISTIKYASQNLLTQTSIPAAQSTNQNLNIGQKSYGGTTQEQNNQNSIIQNPSTSTTFKPIFIKKRNVQRQETVDYKRSDKTLYAFKFHNNAGSLQDGLYSEKISQSNSIHEAFQNCQLKDKLGHSDQSAVASLSQKIKKPKIHKTLEIVDIQSSMETGNLNKISNALLIQFLKSKCIPCRIKDRKEHLVQKVIQFFSNNKTE